jgi:hypothetical protein
VALFDPPGGVAFVLPNSKIHDAHIEKVTTRKETFPHWTNSVSQEQYENLKMHCDTLFRISSMTNSFQVLCFQLPLKCFNH